MIRKRSVTLAGHRTSVSVEEEFWTELKAIAAKEGRAVNDLLTELDVARGGNLSSAIRLYVLHRIKAQ
jgi:predicted DNA-binding ribbon-helix-helix protein